MAGILKVDKYQDFNGNDIMTSDGSGNLTLNNSALKNTPAFYVYLSGSQSITSATFTKVQFDTENFDTDSAFDSSTNYRFTVPSGEAGKYKFYFDLSGSSDSNNATYVIAALYKNGSLIKRSEMNSNSTANAQFRRFQVIASATLDLSVADYVEAYAYINGTSPFVQAGTGNRSHFEGYKLIGV